MGMRGAQPQIPLPDQAETGSFTRTVLWALPFIVGSLLMAALFWWLSGDVGEVEPGAAWWQVSRPIASALVTLLGQSGAVILLRGFAGLFVIAGVGLLLALVMEAVHRSRGGA